MEHSILIVLLALLQYLFFVIKVDSTRGKYNVDAPQTIGNETWERYYRVQQNTLEQLVIFIPGLLIFSIQVDNIWVIIPGVMFILGRQIYFSTYIKDPKTRAPGMVLTILANTILIVGSIIALGLTYIA